MLSVLRPPAGPVTVWVVAGDARDVEAAYPAIDAALARRPGHRLLITVPADSVAAVRRRLPHERVLQQPGRLGLRRWLRKLAPALVVRIGTAAANPDGAPPSTALLVLADAAGLSADAILSALPPDARPRRANPNDSLAERFVRLLAGPAIGGIDELRNRLRAPASILCLGNGPSSEDPALAGPAGDCLFRVNWIWRARGLLTDPDVVFTADPDLPPARSRPIICFPGSDAGLPILARHVLRLSPPRGYLFLDRLAHFATDLAVEPIPTNGALMIAVAAALRPRRIVIAGVDLYAHPAGRYPGDTDAVDGYGRQHSRARDLAAIRAALAGFDGEVRILGDALGRALERG